MKTFVVESRWGTHRFPTLGKAKDFCDTIFRKTGIVLGIKEAHQYSAAEQKRNKHRRMLIEFRQGQADRKAGRPCLSTNGRYLEGWYDPERHLPDFLTQKMLEEIENGPE